MTSRGTAITLTDVRKTFDGTVAVDGLSLEVPRGALYGFIGPNGSGKTTTLRMIMNILLPDAGRISVLGSENTLAARDRISYLPEERGLYKKMTTRRLLRYYGLLKGAPRGALNRRITAWLHRLGLAEWADRRVEALSKGMSQKVQFIAAVVSEPELLILDEPFSGLDPVNAEVLKDAILALRKGGTTVLFSTHDMARAEELCDRIFMIFRGRKVLDGTLADIQQEHGGAVLHIATAAGAAALEGLPGVAQINDRGNLQEVRLVPGADAQALLAALVARTAVHHFELARPSLRDIFVRIARPGEEAGGGSEGGSVEVARA